MMTIHKILAAVVSCGISVALLLTVSLVGNAKTLPDRPAASATPAPIQLIMDTSGPPYDHVAAIEGTFFIPDPFLIVNLNTWINQGVDRNARINIFVTNLELAAGEVASDVKVNLLDHDSHAFELDALSVLPLAGLGFAQVTFRLPDTIATGSCNVTVRWQNQATNTGIISIRPPKPKFDLHPFRDTVYVPDNCPRTFVIKNTGPQGSTLDYFVSDPNGWTEITNRSGSLAAGQSANLILRIHPYLLGDLDLLPTQTFVVVDTPDASNYIRFPVGLNVKNISRVAEALIGTWRGTWSGTSQGRDNPPQPTPMTNVSGTWELSLQSVDTVNGTAAGTLTWKGTDAYWTYSVNSDGTVLSTPQPFVVDRTFPFNSNNTQFLNSGFGNCNQGHRFRLVISGPQPYGPTMFAVEMNADLFTAITTGNGFNANPYNSSNGDTAFSHGIVTGSKVVD